MPLPHVGEERQGAPEGDKGKGRGRTAKTRTLPDNPRSRTPPRSYHSNHNRAFCGFEKLTSTSPELFAGCIDILPEFLSALAFGFTVNGCDQPLAAAGLSMFGDTTRN